MVTKNWSNKSIEWISIDTKEMMRDTMKEFIDFLKKFNVDYITYQSQSGNKLYMKLAKTNEIVFNPNHEFYKRLGEWVFYNPINILTKKPNISDYDIIEDMSVNPYDTDKWRGTE